MAARWRRLKVPPVPTLMTPLTAWRHPEMAVDKRMAASKELPSVGRENPEPASSISPSSERGQAFAQLWALAGPHRFRVVADAEGFPIIPGGIYARTDEGAAALAGPLADKVTRMTPVSTLSLNASTYRHKTQTARHLRHRVTPGNLRQRVRRRGRRAPMLSKIRGRRPK